MKWPRRRVSLADCHMAASLLHFTKTHWWTPSASRNVFITQKYQLGRGKAILVAQSSLTWVVFLVLIRGGGCGSKFRVMGVQEKGEFMGFNRKQSKYCNM